MVNGYIIITSLSLKQLFVQNSFSNSLSKQYDGFKVELSHLALKMIQHFFCKRALPKKQQKNSTNNDEAEKNKRKGVGAKVILLLAMAAK